MSAEDTILNIKEKEYSKNKGGEGETSPLSEPVLETVDDDARVAQILFVDGRRYKLQHPGNRKALRWRQESISLTEGLSQDKLLDKFFKFSVKPSGHTFEPTLDAIEPNHVEVWLHIANRFLKWELE
ncbi:hypothetical protein CH379_009315 [Leptospira ellisii]|uniref:Uncharacterized protein n=1 Tax=Leptospira ellisii TaxID=2023197 RepID=A0A2N0BAX5_9LEPT|nr:hypothetical protein [Leptospira ellisii]MDV6235824.1 hypothetical protein [Leptospira ellisii]PJZ93686.1 hypothetical protein CH379_06535 [Leptospira ellisii]PKA05028.1 hypothetical protein CH375_07495 [Leptospira ellisii]